MPAIASITANDGETPAVSHTFEPAKTTADYAFWEDRDAGIYVGNKKLTLELIRPKGNGNVGNRNLQLKVRLELPRLEVLGNSSSGITPPPTVAYRLAAEIVYTLPERSTQQERKNLRALTANLISSLQFTDAVEKLAIPY